MARNSVLRPRTLLATVLLLCFAAGPAHAEEPPWPHTALHIQILMRALTYEHNLHRLVSDEVRVGVVFDPSRPLSVDGGAAVVRLLEEEARKRTFLKRRVVVVGVPLPAGEERLTRILGAGFAAVYLTPSLTAKDVQRIVHATRKLKVITMTGVGRYIWSGVTLGVVLRKGRPRILLNYPASLQEGANFSAQLLQLAEVIGRDAKGGEGRPSPPLSAIGGAR